LALSACLLLFLSAFVAATLLPMQSEGVLAMLLLRAEQPALLLIGIATAGNVLGAACNWLLGRYIGYCSRYRWFPVGEAALDKARQRYRRFGRWSLLLSWMPVIGDPLTVVAGIMREPLRWFIPLVLVAKLGRYIVVAAATLGTQALL
jgi:membrane protein YqaA with SNARE-associated domain